MGEAVMGPGEARVALDEVSRLRGRIRRERQVFWFPALVFAVVALASAGFFPPDPFASGLPGVTVGGNGGPHLMLGGQGPQQSGWLALYWLIAIPAGYLLTSAYYVWRARRRGVVSAWRVWASTGFALFAFLVFAVQRFWGFLPGDLTIRGLLPLAVVAVGFGVLAAAQRSLEFGVFAAGLFGVALAANLYDMENLTQRLGLSTDNAPYVNSLVVGVVLLVGSVYFRLRSLGWRIEGRLQIVRTAP